MIIEFILKWLFLLPVVAWWLFFGVCLKVYSEYRRNGHVSAKIKRLICIIVCVAVFFTAAWGILRNF